MAITVKKKRTVKTIKSKAKLGAGEAPGSVEAQEAQEAQEEPAVAAPQPSRRGGGRVRVDGRKYTYAVVFAILAILMFIGLIALQSLELSFYYQPRPVFLRKVPVTAMPSGTASGTPPPEPASAPSDAE